MMTKVFKKLFCLRQNNSTDDLAAEEVTANCVLVVENLDIEVTLTKSHQKI